MNEFEAVCVHLFDGSDPKIVAMFESDNGQSFNYMTTYKLLVPFNMSPGTVSSWIKRNIGANKIHILRIVAHGDSGAFFLGQVYSKNSFVHWKSLQGCFDPAARIEMHSCAVASDVRLHDDMRSPGANIKHGTFSGSREGAGAQFMRALAQAVNAKVIASYNDQWANHSHWNLWSHAISDWVIVYPSGVMEKYIPPPPMVPDP